MRCNCSDCGKEFDLAEMYVIDFGVRGLDYPYCEYCFKKLEVAHAKKIKKFSE